MVLLLTAETVEVEHADPRCLVQALEPWQSGSDANSTYFAEAFNRTIRKPRNANDTMTLTPSDSASAFLRGVYEYAGSQSAHQQGSIAIMRHLDGLLHSGDTETCNDILQLVDLDKLPPRMALSLLTITRLVPDSELPAKASLISRLRMKLQNEVGHERAASILGNG